MNGSKHGRSYRTTVIAALLWGVFFCAMPMGLAAQVEEARTRVDGMV